MIVSVKTYEVRIYVGAHYICGDMTAQRTQAEMDTAIQSFVFHPRAPTRVVSTSFMLRDGIEPGWEVCVTRLPGPHKMALSSQEVKDYAMRLAAYLCEELTQHHVYVVTPEDTYYVSRAPAPPTPVNV